ncbi:MAG: (2Fe-2S) ferredoxin domain-containing protein [Bdellovibrionales bacterium]|nr:(2Fe-2S) ferredoxin domain-containing protein [Bdellovibrionales bacterium]
MLPEVPTPKPMRRLERHVFVCANERPPGTPRSSCKGRGCEAVLDALKQEAAAAGLAGAVRVQKSGCLDTCEYGTTVTVYPEGVWYGRVTPADAAELVKSHLVEGRPVERLRIPGK